MRQRILHAIPRTPTGPRQRDIGSYFLTPSTNPDNRGSTKMGAESGGKPNGRQEDGYSITYLKHGRVNRTITDEAAALARVKRSSTPTPLARTPSKKTKAETPLLATPESRNQNSARGKRSYISDPNNDIDGSPCSKKRARNAESKENSGPPTIVDCVYRRPCH